jgi:hypothetical protein
MESCVPEASLGWSFAEGLLILGCKKGLLTHWGGEKGTRHLLPIFITREREKVC